MFDVAIVVLAESTRTESRWVPDWADTISTRDAMVSIWRSPSPVLGEGDRG